MKQSKMTRLKIGGVPEHFNLPWKLAMEDGNLREHGIVLHWEDMGGGTGQMIRGLENKTLDVAVLLTEGITKAILNGLDAKILQFYVSSPLRWGIHVPFHSDIHEVNQLKGKTFAISREGSGSHLMSYVLADKSGWDVSKLDFNIVGDVYGGLWALENDEAQAFLWDKFTTQPYVEKEKCRYIGDVVTPWPCFVVAVRKELLEEHESKLFKMCEIVNQEAKRLKENHDAKDIIAWRYGLKQDEARQWLNETEWNYTGATDEAAFENVIENLLRLQLISSAEAEDYQQKLFV
jgi:ABC-type nitrate/sulfonate/bicarbonate transport system substrate-binding protein